MLVVPPKPRREVRVDLSGLTSDQVFHRRGVVRLGELAFGPRWQTDLAAALSLEAGRQVRQSQISAWVSGERAVPMVLIEPLKRIAVRIAEDMERRAAEIRADWADQPPADDVAAIEGA